MLIFIPVYSKILFCPYANRVLVEIIMETIKYKDYVHYDDVAGSWFILNISPTFINPQQTQRGTTKNCGHCSVFFAVLYWSLRRKYSSSLHGGWEHRRQGSVGPQRESSIRLSIVLAKTFGTNRKWLMDPTGLILANIYTYICMYIFTV